MKKTKFIVIGLLFCVLLTILLTGCSNGNKPSKNQILKDLKESFVEKYKSYSEVIKIKNFDVELSESGEKEYTANLNITAKSNSGYAEIYWKADVRYLKYDQGWRMEECLWENDSDSYKIVKYPSKNEIINIVNGIKGENAKVEKIDILKDESEILCRVVNEVNWSKYASGKIVTNLILDYDSYSDRWGEASDVYIDREFVLKDSLKKLYIVKSGKHMELPGTGGWNKFFTFPDYYIKDGSISINNVTDNGIYITCYSKKLNVSNVYFELESVSVSDDNMRLNFFEKNDVVFNGSNIGNAILCIDLNKSSSFNGEVELTFNVNNESFARFIYANTSSN